MLHLKNNCPFCGSTSTRQTEMDRVECCRCKVSAPVKVWEASQPWGRAMHINTYIAREFDGNASAFARSLGITRQHLQHWINRDYVIANGSIYSWRRYL